MARVHLHPASVLATALVVLSSTALGQSPGDVFREYRWRPRDNWQRVTGPDATHSGAKQFLPNPVNRITIGDLQHATRVEVQIERLQSHAGTRNPRMRVNGGSWLAVPEPDPSRVPGTRGVGNTPNVYLTMTYPIVKLSLGQVRQGTNTFEFTCQGTGGQLIGRLWPQWLVYGVTFRVYYDPAKKAHPNGAVTSPSAGAWLGDNPTFEARASSPAGIAQIDFVGDYWDFDWSGQELTGNWQYNFRYGVMQKHIGTAKAAPWRVRWDTSWIPTQPKTFRVAARIVDNNGLIYMTPAAGDLILGRATTVVRYLSTKISQQWQSQKYSPTKTCESWINEDPTRGSAARLFLTTWNGYEAREIGLNGRKVAGSIGKNHDLDYNVIDVSPSQLRQGQNKLYTWATTEHHGIEVQWPGIEIFVRYDRPEFWAKYDVLGQGCAGTAGVPRLLNTGRPVIGKAFALHMYYPRAWSPVVLSTGVSGAAWGAIPLPFDLGLIGAPGCRLQASLDQLLPAVTNEIGLASLIIGVPNDRRLVGARYWNQSFWHDPAANALGWIVSNAGKATVAER